MLMHSALTGIEVARCLNAVKHARNCMLNSGLLLEPCACCSDAVHGYICFAKLVKHIALQAAVCLYSSLCIRVNKHLMQQL